MAVAAEPGLAVDPMKGLGTDVVDLDRFRLALARTPRLRERLFTAGERAVADARRDPIPALAVRFAAKEAVMKALGVGLGAFAWHDVEVERATSGRPTLNITGTAATLAAEAGVTAWHLSLSHSDLVAMAVVAAD
ncbi:holo-ACP synthase [Iamia sp.]|uniref:holo-ACP synthase n=1 Tax=Iamia sp. TaxID=2722710 RepID=UPI002C38387F|nr:holo-ACP synthase [Iamia sp.]HXH57940.1 holo-ACP synthase [Iamia sp.]